MDSKLAELYGVATKRLNEQVKRNVERFPDDFMFQINAQEYENMRSHFATGSREKRNRIKGGKVLSGKLESKVVSTIGKKTIKVFRPNNWR